LAELTSASKACTATKRHSLVSSQCIDHGRDYFRDRKAEEEKLTGSSKMQDGNKSGNAKAVNRSYPAVYVTSSFTLAKLG
jgi:hypothetical protein